MGERQFLVFHLQGPLAAWGATAVGERRPVWDAPSKSAVLGLLAAGLGVGRHDGAAHAALDAGLGFAVRQDAPGRPLRDYHTAQAPKARRNANWRTRRDELSADDLNTVLSDRLYRVEAAATVAVWLRTGADASLDSTGLYLAGLDLARLDLAALAAGLIQPRYSLYLGRKSCPLGRPPRPRMLAASGLLDAFAAYDAMEGGLWARFPASVRPTPRRNADAVPVWFEWGAGLTAEENQVLAQGERRRRRDAVTDRTRHLYADREEGCLLWQPRFAGEGTDSADRVGDGEREGS